MNLMKNIGNAALAKIPKRTKIRTIKTAITKQDKNLLKLQIFF